MSNIQKRDRVLCLCPLSQLQTQSSRITDTDDRSFKLYCDKELGRDSKREAMLKMSREKFKFRKRLLLSIAESCIILRPTKRPEA
jgi:hypothetical protein